MGIQVSDVKFKKSTVISDSALNGGVRSTTEVLSGVRHSLFPRVTKAERTSGITRYRKEFFSNESASDEIAYGGLLFFELPSTAMDRFYMAKGTQRDTQGDIDADSHTFVGTGILNADVTATDTSVDVLMENNDFEWLTGGLLHISDKVLTSQTIDSGVNIGDSVEWSVGLSKWVKIAQTDDLTYPNGLCVGASSVMTEQGSTNEEWLRIADYVTTDEVIGTGDGATTQVALTTLANVTNGVCIQAGFTPVVTATCGGQTRTVTVDSSGVCSGYCSAGTLSMGTGVWTIDINWTTAPDNATDITVTYRRNPYSYSGNIATVYLAEAVANNYTAANTYAGCCVELGDVETSVESFSVSSASGTYDDTGNPLVMFNDGTVEDDWIITVAAGGTTFTCSGSYSGAVGGTGTIGSNFSPVNADTGQPYFTLPGAGWGGSWAVSETISFTTHPSAEPIWIKEVVPAGTNADSYNLLVVGWYSE